MAKNEMTKSTQSKIDVMTARWLNNECNVFLESLFQAKFCRMQQKPKK